MKVRVLVPFLVVSVLLNVAGLFAFLLLLKQQRHREALIKESNAIAYQLNTASGGRAYVNESMQRRTFVSHVDSAIDVFGLVPPLSTAAATDLCLVVYLHGMGSSYVEPFFGLPGTSIADALASKRPGTVLISPSYRREASWGNDIAMSDITQNIRQVCQEFPIKRIVLMGTSMGGCTVLAYAAAAPADIKGKLVGVVSVESAGDLQALYNESAHPGVKAAIARAYGGSPLEVPEVYKRKSFLANIDALPSGVRVAVVSAREDDIVPARLQRDIVKELKKLKFAAKLIEIDGGHGAPPVRVYLEGYDFVIPTGTSGALPQVGRRNPART